LFSITSASAAAGPILAVFSHPDDETTVAPLLARYAEAGHRVYLVVVTSGQVGDANTDIPRGEQLGAAREAEARCSAEALGITKPFLLGFMDGSISTWETIPKIREEVRAIIEKTKPEVVITWGPDGLSGHPDHRTVSNLTTEIFQQRSKLIHRPDRLYYVSLPESLISSLPPAMKRFSESMGLVSDEWVTTVVDGSAHVEAAWNSIQCHKTQWPPERMEMLHRFSRDILGGRVYLRLALGKPSDGAKRSETVFP
jgi:LmbE family N-acetylglucosaminyl deacetylase